MSLETYTDETRADIVDAERLQLLFDEIESVLDAILSRLDALENR
jgi:hypothetical protein